MTSTRILDAGNRTYKHVILVNFTAEIAWHVKHTSGTIKLWKQEFDWGFNNVYYWCRVKRALHLVIADYRLNR